MQDVEGRYKSSNKYEKFNVEYFGKLVLKKMIDSCQSSFMMWYPTLFLKHFLRHLKKDLNEK